MQSTESDEIESLTRRDEEKKKTGWSLSADDKQLWKRKVLKCYCDENTLFLIRFDIKTTSPK